MHLAKTSQDDLQKLFLEIKKKIFTTKSFTRLTIGARKTSKTRTYIAAKVVVCADAIIETWCGCLTRQGFLIIIGYYIYFFISYLKEVS
jgi:hypothetical protein